jgi:hypothetical protein
MLNFKEWLKNENMWGNVPCKTRKPSDGWVGKQSYSSNGSGGTAAAAPMQKNMKKNMKK